MRTNAENTLYSEALIFILKLLSQVKSDCHEHLWSLGLWRSLKSSEDFFLSGLKVVEIEAR